MEEVNASFVNDNNYVQVLEHMRLNSIINQLGQLHHCLHRALARYRAQTERSKAGIISSLTNHFTTWRQGTNNQNEGVGKLIANLNYAQTRPCDYINALLAILNSDDFRKNDQQGRTSLLSHLITEIHANENLLLALDLCALGTTAALTDHDTLFNQYNYKIRYGVPLQQLMSTHEQIDRKIYRCFFRDYLRAVLNHWQKLPLNITPLPFNLLFGLCRHAPIRENFLSFLDAQDLQKLGLATLVQYPLFQSACDSVFKSCNKHYVLKARIAQAQTLRDLILAWDYQKIEAQVLRDPKILSIVCDYKMNRWQNDSAIHRLSALQYAYVACDENLIELFERLGKDHVEPISAVEFLHYSWQGVILLSHLSISACKYVTEGNRDELEQIWLRAPTWVYALVEYFYQRNENAGTFNVYGESFRSCTGSLVAPQGLPDYHMNELEMLSIVLKSAKYLNLLMNNRRNAMHEVGLRFKHIAQPSRLGNLPS